MSDRDDAKWERKTTDVAVCVIIAAKDASDTIGIAVSSALAEPEVHEVIVVDDGSIDETAATAQAQDDGSKRLQVYRLSRNMGPSYARNFALSLAKAPLVSLLDADDFFLPGRFSSLLVNTDWDLIADNIVFIEQRQLASFCPAALESLKAKPRLIDLVTFVEHNISKRKRRRGELGFLKPVIRREFLDRNALRYEEHLRLGEDYDLYVRALAAGARFKIVGSCGYAAVVRDGSLSGQHSTDDLYALAQADRKSLQSGQFNDAARRAVRKHERHILYKYHHRRVLDLKNSQGVVSCMAYALHNPDAILPTAGSIFRDKLDAFITKMKGDHTPDEPQRLRYLLDVSEERSFFDSGGPGTSA
jgi:succinoglycan biosynthesis protein ExoU